MPSIRTLLARTTSLLATLAFGLASGFAVAGGDGGLGGGAQPDPALRLGAESPTPPEPADPVAPATAEQAAPIAKPVAQAPVPQPNPTLRLPGDDGGDSYQLAAQLEDGSFLLARILITNAGPGDRNAIATGLWIESDGTVHSFDNVRRSSEWKLSGDRRRFDIGSTHLDVSGDYARYWITKKRIQVDVQFPLRAGATLPDDFEPTGSQADLLATLVPIVGTVQLREWSAPRELRGTASLVHGWSKSAAFGGARRITASARDRATGESLLVMQAQTPKGPSRAIAIRRSSADELDVIEGFEARAEGRMPGDRPERYPTPAALALSGAQAEGRVLVGELLFERDLIGSLPQPLRTMMGFALDARPRRVWARASIDVTLRPVSGGTPRRFQGEGTAAIAFSDTFSGR